jgi:tetratricopeptide (TPR) repeat protein
MIFYAEAKEAIDPIIELALKGGYKRRLPQILTIIGNYEYHIEEDVPKAFEHLEEAVKISEELKDNVSLGLASWRLGLARSLNCEFERSAYCYEKALDTMVAANNLWGIVMSKSYLSNFSYFWLGKIELAYQTSDEAVQIAEESGDIYSKAWAYVSTKHILKGIDSCERINLFTWNAVARWFIGEVYYEMGEYQNSKDHYTKGVWLVEQCRGFRSWLTLHKTGVAMAKVMLNEKDFDLEMLYVYLDENKLKFCENWKLRYLGEILLNIDDQHIPEAEDWIKNTIEVDRQDRMRWYLAKDYTLYAELLKRKGDKLKAKENLIKAVRIFKECGADGWVERTEKEVDSLS